MSQAAAIRRRRQARQGYNHLAKKRRPKYATRSAEASKRHLEQLIARERAMQQRKPRKK